jgi:hypothetical protein
MNTVKATLAAILLSASTYAAEKQCKEYTFQPQQKNKEYRSVLDVVQHKKQKILVRSNIYLDGTDTAVLGYITQSAENPPMYTIMIIPKEYRMEIRAAVESAYGHRNKVRFNGCEESQ